MKKTKRRKTKIEYFTGEYRFLSNFYPAKVNFAARRWPTVEHAYQAAKTFRKEERVAIHRAQTPGEAKRLGRRVTIRKDWEEIKVRIMKALLRDKFYGHEELKNKLLQTGDSELIEGNHWGDTFWGVCKGVGENHLGKLLMEIREELRQET